MYLLCSLSTAAAFYPLAPVYATVILLQESLESSSSGKVPRYIGNDRVNGSPIAIKILPMDQMNFGGPILKAVFTLPDFGGPKLTVIFSLTDFAGLKLTDISGPKLTDFLGPKLTDFPEPKLTAMFSLTDFMEPKLTDILGPQLSVSSSSDIIELSDRELAGHLVREIAQDLKIELNFEAYLVFCSTGKKSLATCTRTRTAFSQSRKLLVERSSVYIRLPQQLLLAVKRSCWLKQTEL
ncbi:hypothetical protein A6R68_01284 [Neotoma lepida]|uniref:Uncharacterized protein n=1 Tax=Neotoma lepida TaxID=56216 RepID=A0A1A6GXV0_NEOLE|nr:hypothetical protein A6R68_01284 [Neotoma lepida]